MHLQMCHKRPIVLYVHMWESTYAYVQYNILFMYVSQLLCYAYV